MKITASRYHAPAKLLVEWSDGTQEEASLAHLVGALIEVGYIVIDPQCRVVSMAGEVDQFVREFSSSQIRKRYEE